MKYKLILIFLSLSILLKAQAPQYMNYQGVARNSSGTIINSGNVGLKFEILQGSTAVYSEEQSASPSAAGIFTAAIGSGTNVSGSFSSINWANGPYSIRVSLDPSGGTSFTNVGTSQLLSVPYSLYAEKAGSVNLSSGTGISISSGSIINTAPNQTVNITGANVTGIYPDYTITAAPSTSYSAGTGISVTGSVIANTAPDQTVTLVAAGISSVTGTYPSYVIDVPPPALSYNNTTNELTLTQGAVVSTATLTTSSSGSVSITGPNVTGSYPNYTITAVPVTSITSGNSNISVTGTAPNYTISSNPLLTLSGNSLSISNGNTVTLPTGTTYSNGPGISITSGTLITNAAPDQTVTIANGTNVNVNGTYPNFIVNATPSLSIAGNTLSITGGTPVVLPSPPVLSPGAGITINSGTIINTAPDQNVTLTGVGATTVGGTYPNFTIGTPPPTPVTITGTGAAGITTSGNNFTVNVPNPTYNNSTGAFVTGTNTISVVPALSISGNTLTSGPSSNSVIIPSYSGGSGLLLSGSSPSFSLGLSMTGTNTAWNTLGNTGTSAGTSFLGTTDAQDLVFKTANNQRMRIFNATGSIGIGNISTASELLQVETGSNTAMSILSGTASTLFFGNAGNHFLGAVRYDNINNTMNFWTNNTPNRIFIDNTGRVGINTATPSYMLDIFSSSTSGLLNLKTTLANTQITMDDGAASDVYLTTTNGDFNIWTGGTQRVNVTTTGFVGMGTTAPGQQLHVFSSGTNVGLAIDGGAAGRARLGFLPGGVDNGEVGFKNDLTFGTVTNSSLIMATELMRLTSTGRLGIGTTAPANKLHVNGGVTITDGTQGLGKVFTSDATGNGQWKPSQIAFFSGGNPTSTTVNYSASQTATLVFNSGTSSLAYNNGGGYGTSTGVFTAPVAGVYQFDAVCVFAGATSGYVQLKMRHSSGNLIAEQEGFFNSVGQNWFSGKLAATVHLNAGEKVAIEYYAGTGGGSTFYQDKSSFSGHLVYAD